MPEVEYKNEGDGSFPLIDSLYNDSAIHHSNSNIFLAPLNDSNNNVSTNHIISQFTGMPEGYAVPVVFALIFFVGLIGNGTLIYTVIRNKNMRNTPNIFIVSLALGDFLLILVSVPFTATIYTFTEWPYGQAVCKLNEFLQTMSLGVSIFTLVALSGDRYIAILDPMSKHKGNPLLRTMLVASCIWLLAIILAIPDLVAAHIVYKNFGGAIMEICEVYPAIWGSWYPRLHVMWRFVIYFALPMLIIGIFYSLMARILMLTAKHMPGEGKSCHGRNQMNARKKVAKTVLSFVVVFMICWLPRHVYTLWYHYDPGLYNMFWHVFKLMGFCLSFINSCINPMALYFLSKQFRRYYNNYLFCCCTKGEGVHPRRPGVNMDTTHSGGGHAYTTVRRNSNTLLSTQLTATNCDTKI